ncbi:Rv2578c family radical SAM protein [Kineosporia sp. R_H_3]|uniref:Rv2578c family radical SAM protein n=1 Tax=Kineosporia sp. R_H_3 TaxID=1961848 RepID=UPI000B4ADD64|nr:Rv2578c family radical SAM protein [Kineosporia sp. R_H_3]
MRWAGQAVGTEDAGALPGLRTIKGLLRTVTADGFPGVRFHEVAARSALNAVPGGSQMPFRWTVNPYRGCTHACVYCFARGTHAWLDLDTGSGFDTEVVVKTNLVEVLRRELSRPSWAREHVALGTNTDPYQRAEGRYRLMPGVVRALAESGTPLSVLTKGTLLRRDLPVLAEAARSVPVGLGVSLAIHDEALHESLEPGTPSPRARLDVVRAARDAGLPCGVFLAPVLPWLTDSVEHLDTALARLAEAGATGVTVVPLHLRPGAREWFLAWLARERPALVPRYRELYGRGAYASKEYRLWLGARVRPLLRRHGLTPPGNLRGIPGDDEGEYPAGSMPGAADEAADGAADGAAAPRDGAAEQLTIL